MAPAKGIRTYEKKKTLSASGQALNTLLAVNLWKRLETTNDTLGSSKEKSTETTFDRLLKGEVYNNVQLKRFPENDPSDNEESDVSIFSRSGNCTNENKHVEVNASMPSIVMSSPSICSPIVILERNVENRINEAQKYTSEQHATRSVIDGTRNESDLLLQDSQKMELMNSLHLQKNDSFYLSFTTAVNKISTPQCVSKTYFLRKHRRLLSVEEDRKRLQSSSFIDKTNSISHDNLELESQLAKNSSFQGNNCQENNPSMGGSKGIYKTPIKSPQTNVIPVRHCSPQDLSSISRLSESYGIIDEWSNRCPSPNSFNNLRSKINCRRKIIGSGNSFKRKKDNKLFQKAQVILNHIPQIEDIVKDAMPFDLTHFDVKKVPKSFVTRRKVNSKKNQSPPDKNCVVYLTPLNVSELETLEKLPKTHGSQRISYSDQKDEKYDSPASCSRSSEKHKCSLECEHFRKIPKVMLERCVFSRNEFTKKFSIPNKIIEMTNSPLVNNSPTNFQGFESNISHDEVDKLENCVDRIRNNSVSLKRNRKPSHPSNKDMLKKRKDCFVILQSMKENESPDKNEIKSVTEGNDPKKKLSDCWVVINENKHGFGGSISEKSDVFEAEGLNPKIKEFVSLEPGKKFRRSIAIFKKNLEGHMNISGNVSSANRMTLCRRQSVKLIPVSPHKIDQSELASFALSNSGYVSLRQSIRRSSLENVEKYLPNVQPVKNYLDYHTKNSADPLTARDIVLKRCGQTRPLDFEECYPTSALQHCQKIGEGVFGEVFMIRDKDGSTTVMKVIPIEGDQIVNLEKQKTFGEILSEIIISMELSNLRMTKRNNTDAFVKVKRIHCVKGCYPDRLLELWELYDENKESENDSPEMFHSDQLYIVLELANAGQDLESFLFNNAQQSLAVFEQVTCALAVAESELQFEHRDLHWGNVLITLTEQPNTVFVLDGKEVIVKNRGVKATIIDFTLSRVEYEGVIIFNDLSMDEDLFTAKGDYQFDIYRKMRDFNGNRWQNFKPYSNVLWLHYILCKAIDGFRYKNVKSKQHRGSMANLKAFEKKILDFDSTTNFVKNNFCDLIMID